MGLSEKPIDELIPYAKFWHNTPDIKISDGQFSYQGFNRNERAYRILKKSNTAKVLNMKISGSSKSPVVNPVFVIENWGNHDLELLVDQVKQSTGKDFRYSIRKSLDRDDLIVWVKMETKSEVSLTFIPAFN